MKKPFFNKFEGDFIKIYGPDLQAKKQPIIRQYEFLKELSKLKKVIKKEILKKYLQIKKIFIFLWYKK